jgi:hypothetical protein
LTCLLGMDGNHSDASAVGHKNGDGSKDGECYNPTTTSGDAYYVCLFLNLSSKDPITQLLTTAISSQLPTINCPSDRFTVPPDSAVITHISPALPLQLQDPGYVVTINEGLL